MDAAKASKSVPGRAFASFGSGYHAPSVVVMLSTASLVPRRAVRAHVEVRLERRDPALAERLLAEGGPVQASPGPAARIAERGPQLAPGGIERAGQPAVERLDRRRVRVVPEDRSGRR